MTLTKTGAPAARQPARVRAQLLGMTAICALVALAPTGARASDADELHKLRQQMQEAQAQMAAQAKAMQAMQDRLNTLEAQQTQTAGQTAASTQTAAQAAQQAQAAQSAAQAAQKVADDAAHPKLPKDGSLTFYGITLYGAVDMGFSYQSHGAPLSPYYPPGLDYLVSKNGNKGIASLAPNGLSQSKVGLRGEEEFADGWSALFKVETGFNPQSGQLADGPRSMAANNGLALTKQTANGDSSHAGQAFNRAAYVGVSSREWGTVTVGRQNTLLADNIFTYDPQQASYAFSVIGFSGLTGGGGSTEDFRLDNTVKYTNQFGPLRVGALYQFGEDNGGMHGNALQLDAGTDIGGLSVDATYAHKQDMVSAGNLTAAQMTQATALGYNPGNSLAATISDNTSYALMGSYTLAPQWKLFAGYEYIDFANPSVPLRAGATDIGGYTLAFVNNSAFVHDKIVQVAWTGARYAVTPKVDVSAAYYHYGQNSYGAKSCADASAATCSGTLNAYSLVADYRFARRFDAYLGVMYSEVAGGLAAGYLHTDNVSPTTGVRFNF
ncbi:porin [Nitrospirillum sp. BR 11828]|uniref:porin n=1 Tax=Nitrospirillum sp. BR 11828 TaxID=3104325 RepID=UPI002ACA8123|nr:porin [Nitrospirillum sp. BR 11828]MDZ5649623.1 porin [Nitrospirillum sp. BR 11828]